MSHHPWAWRGWRVGIKCLFSLDSQIEAGVLPWRRRQPRPFSYDDFAKLDLRVATVLECKPHANADKLLVLQIDLGTENAADLRRAAPALSAGATGRQADRRRGQPRPAPDARRNQPGHAPGRHRPGDEPVIVVTPGEAVAAGSKVS